MTDTKNNITKQIAKLHNAGEALNISAVKERHPALLTAVYDHTPFWGWKQALEDSGLSYSDIEVYLPEHVRCEICGKQFKSLGMHIKQTHNMTVGNYRTVYKAFEIVSPANAAKLADPGNSVIPHWEPNWTPQYVLDRVYALDQLGIPMNATHINMVETATLRWAKRYHGGWKNVLSMLNIETRPSICAPLNKYKTKQDVIKEIHHRVDAEKPIYCSAVRHGPSKDLSLWNKGRRLFGSWRDAVEVAGYDYNSFTPLAPKYTSPEEVLSGIRERYEKGLPITSVAIRKGPDRNPRLYSRAFKFFDDWVTAVEAEGIPYESLRDYAQEYPR